MECNIWCCLLVFICATASVAEAAADEKPLSIEDLEELDDNLGELLSDEDHVVEKREYPRARPASHHEYSAAAATAHYGQQRLTGGSETQHQKPHGPHHHEVQGMSREQSVSQSVSHTPLKANAPSVPPARSMCYFR